MFFFKLFLVATNSTRRCSSTVSVKVKHGAPLDVMINHVVRQEDVVLRRRWAVLYACAMYARARRYMGHCLQETRKVGAV